MRKHRRVETVDIMKRSIAIAGLVVASLIAWRIVAGRAHVDLHVGDRFEGVGTIEPQEYRCLVGTRYFGRVEAGGIIWVFAGNASEGEPGELELDYRISQVGDLVVTDVLATENEVNAAAQFEVGTRRYPALRI